VNWFGFGKTIFVLAQDVYMLDLRLTSNVSKYEIILLASVSNIDLVMD